MTVRQTTDRRPVDWAELWRRVDAVGYALDAHAARTPEEARAVLEERARVLARRPEPAPRDASQVLTFRLAGETYAIRAEHVVEVFRLDNLTLLPGAAPPAFAVTARRGELLTILDLRRALGLSPVALNDLTTVIAVGDDAPAFGLLVDAVDRLATVHAEELHAPPRNADGEAAVARPHVRGITADAVTVLDGGALLRLYE
jgi:purine-binding chemotaxis protein CheW